MNMRYHDSVGDRGHELLSERLVDIFELFGQVASDILEDTWVDIALGDERYSQVADIDWDSCGKVLDAGERRKMLMVGSPHYPVLVRSYPISSK